MPPSRAFATTLAWSSPPSTPVSAKPLEQMIAKPHLREQLNSNACRLYDGLTALGFVTGPAASPIVAATMPDVERAIAMWNGLLQSGVYLNLALPPAMPDSRPLLRASISAAHTHEQIDQVLKVFAEVGAALGVIDGQQRAFA